MVKKMLNGYCLSLNQSAKIKFLEPTLGTLGLRNHDGTNNKLVETGHVLHLQIIKK